MIFSCIKVALNNFWWKTFQFRIQLCSTMFFISVIILFIPSICNWKYKTNNIVDVIENLVVFKMLNMILVGLSLPLLTEAVLDYFQKTTDIYDVIDR